MRAQGGEALAERLALEPRHMDMVWSILEETIPGRAVWAFGSRATGRHLKRFSDLDLGVEGRLSWDERATLAEAFDESLLPIKVDVVELAMTDADFAERIRRDFVLVQAGRVGNLADALAGPVEVR